jgi:hypothetical protein
MMTGPRRALALATWAFAVALAASLLGLVVPYL